MENFSSCPSEYSSNAWEKKDAITWPWLVGFIEAEGSFYITKKDNYRLVHGFGLTQKRDKIVLLSIKEILKIESQVKYNKKGFYSLDTTNSKSLKYIKDSFFRQLKSIKSLEYRIWARSFRDKGKYEKLLKVKKIIDKIRNTPIKE
jgi:hypothetical protein